MSKKPIKETDNYQLDWYKSARSVKNFDDLKTFIGHLLDDYEHDYGTYVHAVSASALATISFVGKDLSGFQAGEVMWQLIRALMFSDNKCGLKIINYDDMLYPKHSAKFEKYISEEVWECIQKEALNNLADAAANDIPVNPLVVAHWQSIIEGTVPYGYTVMRGL